MTQSRFKCAPWVESLNKAIRCGGTKNKRLIKANKYMQLATTAVDGRPHVRTVVFRGFYTGQRYNPWAMTFITDMRSTKIQDLRKNAFAEVCSWISGANTQFRISGRMHVLTADSDEIDLKIRQDLWSKLPRHTTAFCTWKAPGQPKDGSYSDSSEIKDIEGDDDAHPNFCVLVLEPDFVDHLRLGSNQARWIYKYNSHQSNPDDDGGSPIWTEKEVTP
mmetsp:Transcript_8087/g.15004  ORF Transcript_8087/g.15004 Transcript_8087/m.15004 type:complete len:219 (+) Transcript_8087:336-992(+)